MKIKIKTFVPVAAGIFAVGFVQKETKRRKVSAASAGQHIPYGPYEALFKRPFDILLSGTALILLAPVMAATALAVYVKLGSQVLFQQQRPGLDGKIFTIYKFRTMTDEKDGDGKLLADGQRLTEFGKWLRSTSLDELPELVNILKGDMSIVGPRPLLVEYLPRYHGLQRHRHDVRPGLTGLAQVSGRNGIGWDEKFKNDVRYLGRVTFFGDVKIIFATVKAVFTRNGINSSKSETMEVFVGCRENG